MRVSVFDRRRLITKVFGKTTTCMLNFSHRSDAANCKTQTEEDSRPLYVTLSHETSCRSVPVTEIAAGDRFGWFSFCVCVQNYLLCALNCHVFVIFSFRRGLQFLFSTGFKCSYRGVKDVNVVSWPTFGQIVFVPHRTPACCTPSSSLLPWKNSGIFAKLKPLLLWKKWKMTQNLSGLFYQNGCRNT